MKTYLEPETHVLQVIHSGAICTGSAPAPVPATTGQLGTMVYGASGAWK